MTIAATPAAPAAAEAPAQPVHTPDLEDVPEGGEKPKIDKIQQLRRLLATKRLSQEQRSQGKAEERQTRKRGEAAPVPKEGDADRPVDKTAKAETKEKPEAKEKAEAKAKPEAKDEIAERDASGRFLPKDGEVKEKPEAKPKDEPPAPAAKTADKPKEETETKPEPAAKAEPAKPAPGPDPETKRLEDKYARLMLDTKRKDEELVTAREQVKKAKALEEARDKVKGGEIDEEALELLTGRTYEQLVRAVAKGPDAGGARFKPKVQLHPALLETKTQLDAELVKIREHNEKIERESRDAETKRQREETQRSSKDAIVKETAQLTTWLTEEADKYPRLSSLPNGASRLLTRWYDDWAEASGVDERGEVKWNNGLRPDPEEVAAKMEASLSGELGSIFASERALRVALQDPKTRELVVKVLGADAAPPSQPKVSPPQRSDKGNQANADGPRTLSNKVTQEARTDASRPQTPEERSAYRAEKFRSWKAQRGQPVR